MKTKTEVQIEKGCRIKKSKLKSRIKVQIEKAQKIQQNREINVQKEKGHKV